MDVQCQWHMYLNVNYAHVCVQDSVCLTNTHAGRYADRHTTMHAFVDRQTDKHTCMQLGHHPRKFTNVWWFVMTCYGKPHMQFGNLVIICHVYLHACSYAHVHAIHKAALIAQAVCSLSSLWKLVSKQWIHAISVWLHALSVETCSLISSLCWPTIVPQNLCHHSVPVSAGNWNAQWQWSSCQL